MKNSQGASGKKGRTSSIDSLDMNQFPRSYLQAHIKKDHKPPVSFCYCTLPYWKQKHLHYLEITFLNITPQAFTIPFAVHIVLLIAKYIYKSKRQYGDKSQML